ncbi:MAG: DNA polymerase Y family protein [Actinomycetaceae bacterium]|nr:DNA polymerase Y family protein [Actinomycetaceae bacterium]
MRRITLWVPDWPVNALVCDVPPGAPAALIDERRRIVLATPSARRGGVHVGMRSSLAVHVLPDLILLPRDADREGRVFEEVLRAFDALAAGVVCHRPGLAWAPARGPSRWIGSEEALAECLIDSVAENTGAECQVGIAEGPFAALAAAKRGVIIPPGQEAAFLLPLPLSEAAELFPSHMSTSGQEILGALSTLGVRMCGQFLDLGRGAVLSRFGAAGEYLWFLASGGEAPFPSGQRSIHDEEVLIECDPPLTQVESALFTLRAGAADLSQALVSRGLVSSGLTMTLISEEGREYQRSWTGVNACDTDQVIERLRWQIRGWIQGGDAPESPLVAVRITARELSYSSPSEALWGRGRGREGLEKSVMRVRALLGEDSILTPLLQGGYDPRNRILFTPWGKENNDALPCGGEWEGAVWEAPGTLFDSPIPVDFLGEAQGGIKRVPVRVNARGFIEPVPALIRIGEKECPQGIRPFTGQGRVVGYEGPWPIVGQWWAGEKSSQGTRTFLRISLENGPDCLLSLYLGKGWHLEGIYD